MEKIFNQKNFNYFVWTPLGSRVNININFCLQVLFKESAAWYFSIFCHRCRWYRWQFAAGIVDTGGKFAAGINNTSETGGKICRRCHWYRWQFATDVVDTGGNFAAGVVDTGGKFATGVVDTGGAPWLANISANFRKKIRNGPSGILWDWGETDPWKKLEAKNLVTLSL